MSPRRANLNELGRWVKTLWITMSAVFLASIGVGAYVVITDQSLPTVIETPRAEAQSSAASSGEGSLQNKIVVLQPLESEGEALSGYRKLSLESSLFIPGNTISADTVTVYYVNVTPTGTFSGSYAKTLTPEDRADTPGGEDTIPNRVTVPFDTTILPNGLVNMKVCPGTATDSNCSDLRRYTIGNTITITTPTTGELFSNELPYALSYSGEAAFNISIFNAAGTTPVFLRSFITSQASTSTSGRHPITDLPDGQYLLRVEFLHLWNSAGLNLERLASAVAMFGVNRTTVAPAPTPTTNTNSSTNTNTSIGGPDAETPSDDQQASATTPPPPLINFPADAQRYRDVSTIRGSLPTGNEVGLWLRRLTTNPNSTAGSYTTIMKTQTTSEPTFDRPIGSSLVPGFYELIAVAMQNGVASPERRITFSVELPTIRIVTENPTISGVGTLEAGNDGPIKFLEFIATQGTTQSSLPITLGRATRVAGRESPWTLRFDSKNLKDGAYALSAVAEALDGTRVSTHNTQAIRLTVKNELPGDPPTPAAPPTTPTPTPTPDPIAPVSTDPAPPAIVIVPTIPNSTTNQVTELTKIDDPRSTSVAPSPRLRIDAVTNLTVEGQPDAALKLTGIGPPNAVVTIFIYSDPIIVTTRTDANGNWSYTLDRGLSDGSHEVYVTVTDETGKIQETSNPLGFFVAEARAVTEDQFRVHQDALQSGGDSYLSFYVIIAGLLVALTVVIFLLIRLNRRHGALSS